MKTLFVLAALVAACTLGTLPSAAAPASATVTAALSRWRTFLGGPTIERCEVLETSGRIEAAGLHGTLQQRLARRGLYRSTFDLGPLRGGEGIDAAGAWRRNNSGQLEGLPAASALRLRWTAALTFGQLPGDAAPLDGGRSSRDGVDCDVVRLTSPAGDLSMYIAADGRLVALRSGDGSAGDEPTWTSFGDWRQVDGIRVPFRIETIGPEPQVVTIERAVANQHLAVDAFARPAPATPTLADQVIVPVDLYLERYLFVRGSINGVATDLVVDSGAGITVVDRELADRIGLAGSGTVTARGVGTETRTVQLASDVRVRVGDLDLPPLTCAILDLGEVHRQLGRRMPLIVGKELFHAFAVTIDYPARRLVVADAGSYVPPAAAAVLPTRPVDDGHVMIEAQLEDLPPAWFMVDTGSGDTLLLHTPFVQQHELARRWPRTGARLIGGVGGRLTARVARAGTFRLAGQCFRDLPVTMASADAGALASAASAGTLGAGLLSRFCVTFDYAHDQLVFVPGPDVDAPMPHDRLGLSLASTGQADGFAVEFVAADSPAAAAGLVVGDRVVALDGTPLLPTNVRALQRRAAGGVAGTTLRVRLHDGSERSVVLADWY